MSRTRTTKEELTLARRALRATLKHIDRATHSSHLKPTALQLADIKLLKQAAVIAERLASQAAELRDMTRDEARRAA